jgi:hypothetical protein
MNQPSTLVRVAGSPVAAIPLTLGGVRLIFMWTQGRASIWLALIGFFVAVRTISSVRQRNRYKAWSKQWETVGTLGKAPPRRPIPALRWATFLAATLCVGIIACWPNVPDNPQLQNDLRGFWFLCAIFLIGRLTSGVGQLVMKRRNRNARKAKHDAAPVSLMLNRTVDSPCREMAVRNLPEYAARILSRSELRVDKNSQLIH